MIRATTLTIDEATRVETDAQAAGLPVGDYVRARLLQAPQGRAVVGDVVLSEAEAEGIVELLCTVAGGIVLPDEGTRERAGRLAASLDGRRRAPGRGEAA